MLCFLNIESKISTGVKNITCVWLCLYAERISPQHIDLMAWWDSAVSSFHLNASSALIMYLLDATLDDKAAFLIRGLNLSDI